MEKPVLRGPLSRQYFLMAHSVWIYGIFDNLCLFHLSYNFGLRDYTADQLMLKGKTEPQEVLKTLVLPLSSLPQGWTRTGHHCTKNMESLKTLCLFSTASEHRYTGGDLQNLRTIKGDFSGRCMVAKEPSRMLSFTGKLRYVIDCYLNPYITRLAWHDIYK